MQSRLYFAAAAMLCLATLPLPYGYYMLLRLVVAVAACLAAFKFYSEKSQVDWKVCFFGGLALLFNPLLPVFLTRSLWLWIDLAAALLFCYAALRRRRPLAAVGKDAL
ncbi:DUF6804 family protein [Rhizobium sp. WYCCWR 11146]|uniref:DUF6804 family protein n=1 Tax=Rhizobium TaxID=379 RepID=UPI00387EC738